MEKGLGNFFEGYLKNDSFFKDKKALQSFYTPDTVPHRDEQITSVAKILAPCLKLEQPSNLFIYGKTGTGKTLCIKYVMNELQKTAEQNFIPLKIFYINCKLKKIADTEYRLIAQLAREFGKEIPPTGLPTDEVYKIFFDALDIKEQSIIFILDEIDQLLNKAGDEILYNLTRINSELKKAKLSLVGISNDLRFADNLDPRVKSSLSEEELVFAPYNAVQIKDILKQRSQIAFKENTISDGVIEKCAAYAAREHGDARRALELLRVAAELAERSGDNKVRIEHLDKAEEKIEHDKIIDLITTQPKQHQVVLYSVLSLYSSKRKIIFTGEAYELYKELCYKTNLRPLTQRRLSDIIAEFDMLGIITAKVISKGRYGRTREISLAINQSILPKIRKIIETELQL
ncbi:MAG: ORC1-type DNA replication protein [Candidatus Woesearchaeota archaeon]